jgi:hypothetical protein
MMQNIHTTLYNVLNCLIECIKTESNISNIENIVNKFYTNTNEIC